VPLPIVEAGRQGGDDRLGAADGGDGGTLGRARATGQTSQHAGDPYIEARGHDE